MKRLKGIEILDIITFLITLTALFLAVSGSISEYVRPHHFRWIAAANNILPYTMVISLFILIYWIVRRSWALLIPIFSILINTSTLLSIVQFRSDSDVLSLKKEDIIKVFNYNAQEFSSKSGVNIVADISELILDEAPDIICLQEYKNIAYPFPEVMKNYFDTIPYRFVEKRGLLHSGLAIFSKYKILKSGLLNLGDNENSAIWADLNTEQGVVRIINLQMKINSLSDGKIEIRNLSEKIRLLLDNNEERAAQADELKHFIDTTILPIILCANLNDTPSSYSYIKSKGDKLTDGFREAGSHFGGTYNGMLELFRIDYIFHSSEFKSQKYYTIMKDWSDHRPVISELVYQN